MRETSDAFVASYNRQREEDSEWRSQVTAKIADVQARAATWIIAVGLGVSILSLLMGVIGIAVTILLRVLL